MSLSNCWIFCDTRIRFFVVEVLVLSTSCIEVVGRFRVVHVGDKFDRTFEQVVPIDAFEEGMSLDFFRSSSSETTTGIGAEKPIDEILRVCGDFDLTFMPIEATREDIVEDFFGSFVVEGREAVDESVRLLMVSLALGQTVRQSRESSYS